MCRVFRYRSVIYIFPLVLAILIILRVVNTIRKGCVGVHFISPLILKSEDKGEVGGLVLQNRDRSREVLLPLLIVQSRYSVFYIYYVFVHCNIFNGVFC